MKREEVAKILVAGDTAPIGRYGDFFQGGDVTAILGELCPEFGDADLRILNLECPLISAPAPAQKVGPNLGAPIETAIGLRAANLDIAGLSNNHIMDHGLDGLRSTIDALGAFNIAHVGAGDNLREAREILVRDVNGLRIGIIAVAEREFGMATITRAGAYPLDVIDFVRNVNEQRNNFDFLIVLLHGGNEHLPYPRPELINTCRFMVETGASAVICQHSHCAGSMETYRGAPIVYGQGNFLFDVRSQPSSWSEGCLVEFTFDRKKGCTTRLIPFYQTYDRNGPKRVSEKARVNWLNAFQERSRDLASPNVVHEKWAKFCLDHKRYYLNEIHGNPSLLRRVFGKLDLLHLLDMPSKQRRRLNLIRCESHREALITILEKEAGRGTRS